MKKKVICSVLLGLMVSGQLVGADYIKPKKDKKTGISYYDLNKNGHLDIYENPALAVEERVSALLSQMTLEEKVGQMLTSLGWPMYERQGNTIRLTEQLVREIEEYHTGSLWGFMRADPWTQRTLTTGLTPALAAKASNMLQKYAIEHGRLGIPLFLAEECPHGHMAIGTTVFPTSIGQASTWNPELIRRMGSAIANEASAQGAHIGYGPVLDLARDPRWSRVEETYGEDAYLNGVMGTALVKGFQGEFPGDKGKVIATLKHFAAYGWTEGGHNGGSAHVGKREMEEAIYPPFREAVAAGALSVMSSYNEIDGIPCTANSDLLTGLLKERWQFKGFVVSDLYAIGGLREHGVADTDYAAAVKAVNAGVDSDLGTNVYAGQLVDAVKKGDVQEAVINKAVSRILALKFHMGLFDHPFVDERKPEQVVASTEHLELAREVARQSIILLKNENELLPLNKKMKTIAVIGPNADNVYNMLGDYTAPQSESSVVTVLDGIRQKVSNDTHIIYAKGCAVRDSSKVGFQEAIEAARQSDVVVMVMGGSSARDFSSKYEETGAAKVSDSHISDMESGEGYDRSTLELLGRQRELIREMGKLNKPIVLVLIKGRPLLLEDIEAEVDAIVDAWYPGMQGGNAIADVLFGDYNPAGRLTISVPRSVGQLPVYYNTKRKGNRSKYIEEEGTPRYPFGYGLSYTSFNYSDLRAEVVESEDSCLVNISVKVRNEGSRDGDEVVQLYLRDEVASFTTPFKQLRGFQRIHLKVGETKEITFRLDKKSLALYMQNEEWAVEPGRFTLMLGGSSEQIYQQKEIEITKRYTFKM
ncbi:glycoside hydrolase family 3 N-terminal domain-containing protein [Bacteroides intestinalis]|jgi:beta-glucosidase|uniref:glycoside hydrolase family 3 N-terminal domain-containing protein n=1 Tax=Bacteroides intestinalis TaxID=329854 RepID=UPI00189F08FF|nr:glycoside hydrolase family 3 N-terminal domain-containing protein [Bacteroides intestinalis]